MSFRDSRNICNDDGSISMAAKQFIAESSGATWESVDLSVAGVRALREENSAVAKEAWDNYLLQLLSKEEEDKQQAPCPSSPSPGDDDPSRSSDKAGINNPVSPQVTTREETISGVSVQWILPIAASTAGAASSSSPSTTTTVVSNDKVVILYAFGGAFIVGSPEDDFSMTSRLAMWTGLPVCCPRYRLAPEHPFPAGRDDMWAVYEGLHKQQDQDEHPQRGRRVVVVGESAGGNLALLLALASLNQSNNATNYNVPPPPPPPLALVLMSPWIDLTHSGDSHGAMMSGATGLQDPTLSVEHFLHPAAMAYVGDGFQKDTQRRSSWSNEGHPVNCGGESKHEISAKSSSSSQTCKNENDASCEVDEHATIFRHRLASPDVSPLFATIPSPPLSSSPSPSSSSLHLHFFPPTLISSGTRDLLLSDCVRLATKIRRHNRLIMMSRSSTSRPISGTATLRGEEEQTSGIVELHVAEGLFHVYEWYPQFPESKTSLQTMSEFIRRFIP